MYQSSLTVDAGTAPGAAGKELQTQGLGLGAAPGSRRGSPHSRFFTR